MTDATLSSTLEEIRADLRLAETAGLGDEDAPGDYFPVALYRHSRSLLAAIEAVLRSAETWRALAGDSQAPFDVAIASCAKTVREAVSRVLSGDTGKEASDGG